MEEDLESEKWGCGFSSEKIIYILAESLDWGINDE